MLTFYGSDDYVLDVKWAPNHPAVFAAVDGSGRMDLWNLNVDTEVSLRGGGRLHRSITPVGSYEGARGHHTSRGRRRVEQGELGFDRSEMCRGLEYRESACVRYGRGSLC